MVYNRKHVSRVALLALVLAHCVPFLVAEPPCGLTSIQETLPLIYPPIAKAAHVTGQVILIAEFSTDGSVHSINIEDGPEMLQKSARDFVQGWSANRYGGSRSCPIVIIYKVDTGESNGTFVKKIRSTM